MSETLDSTDSSDARRLDMIYTIEDTPPWYLCVFLGMQVNLQSELFFVLHKAALHALHTICFISHQYILFTWQMMNGDVYTGNMEWKSMHQHIFLTTQVVWNLLLWVYLSCQCSIYYDSLHNWMLYTKNRILLTVVSMLLVQCVMMSSLWHNVLVSKTGLLSSVISLCLIFNPGDLKNQWNRGKKPN